MGARFAPRLALSLPAEERAERVSWWISQLEDDAACALVFRRLIPEFFETSSREVTNESSKRGVAVALQNALSSKPPKSEKLKETRDSREREREIRLRPC